jgi:hypothetical protein
MAKIMRPITKTEVNTIFKVYNGKLTRKQAQAKLGGISDGNFKSLYLHATLDARFKDLVAETFIVR